MLFSLWIRCFFEKLRNKYMDFLLLLIYSKYLKDLLTIFQEFIKFLTYAHAYICRNMLYFLAMFLVNIKMKSQTIILKFKAFKT